jgi:hypothetical protein
MKAKTFKNKHLNGDILSTLINQLIISVNKDGEIDIESIYKDIFED